MNHQFGVILQPWVFRWASLVVLLENTQQKTDNRHFLRVKHLSKPDVVGDQGGNYTKATADFGYTRS